jgi:hypothetical protein
MLRIIQAMVVKMDEFGSPSLRRRTAHTMELVMQRVKSFILIQRRLLKSRDENSAKLYDSHVSCLLENFTEGALIGGSAGAAVALYPLLFRRKRSKLVLLNVLVSAINGAIVCGTLMSSCNSSPVVGGGNSTRSVRLFWALGCSLLVTGVMRPGFRSVLVYLSTSSIS